MLVELSGLPAAGAACDVVVIGAGGAGMAAALYAAIDGASVLLVEHTQHVGGTTAWSGGTTWIPGTQHAAGPGAADTAEDAARYLAAAIGDRAPEAMRRAFLEHGPDAVAHIEAHSEVRYRAYPLHPDYLSELPGSTVRGRALEPLPFDGRRLGKLFALLRPPFYAVRLYPGDIGAATGFATDTTARVLDREDRPIEGLYAVGNDMHSVMGGVYPGPGITIGPGLVFACLAGRDAVRRAAGAN